MPGKKTGHRNSYKLAGQAFAIFLWMRSARGEKTKPASRIGSRAGFVFNWFFYAYVTAFWGGWGLGGMEYALGDGSRLDSTR
jgi:hypothetical protein